MLRGHRSAAVEVFFLCDFCSKKFWSITYRKCLTTSSKLATTGWPKSKFPISNDCTSVCVHFWPHVGKAKMCLRGGSLFQFSKICLHFFSCLFTIQLFVYNSAVCLHFSAKSRFWLFCSKLTPVQRQYPFSVFDSCLFTFWQLFVYFSAVCLLFLSFL